MMEDVFDEDADNSQIHEREWSKLKQGRKNEGLREGISQGQEVTLQDGFNKGYERAFTLVFHICDLKAVLTTYLGYHTMNNKEKEAAIILMSALEKVSHLEEALGSITSEDDMALALDNDSEAPAMQQSSSSETLKKSDKCGTKISEGVCRSMDPLSGSVELCCQGNQRTTGLRQVIVDLQSDLNSIAETLQLESSEVGSQLKDWSNRMFGLLERSSRCSDLSAE